MSRTSVITGGTNADQTTAEDLNAVATDFVTPGVVGTIANTGGVSPATGGLAINAQGTPNMTVALTTGIGYVNATPTGQAAQTLRVKLDAQNVTIASNPGPATVYVWIYAAVSATLAANPDVNAATVGTIVTSSSSLLATDTGTPPAYGIPLAVVTNVANATSITSGNITDKRTQAAVSTVGSSSATGWNSLGYTPSTVVYNGNRNYSLTFSGVDLRPTLSNGMRLKATRTTAAPTQCAALNGTTQYYNKVSPAGMTFTDNFTVSAWVKLASYAQGAIMSRYNGTSGWILLVTANGTVRIQGINGSAASRAFDTYQSIPLNKWVHIAATLNMAGAVSTMYIDGVSVPNVSSGGTATALVQAGNLEVGSYNATNFFPGKIAQAAVFSAVLSAGTIQSYISQGLAGTETSLISAYSLSNSLLDLNANANNLTANGSATTTTVDSPFAGGANASTAYTAGTTEFGEVFNISFSTNTTVVVQVPDGFAIPTSGGVSALAYSTQAAPLGWPLDGGIKEIASLVILTSQTTTAGSPTAALGVTLAPYVPAGRKVIVKLTGIVTHSATSASTIFVIYRGSITAANALTGTLDRSVAGGVPHGFYLQAPDYPSAAGSQTYLVGWYGDAGTMTLGQQAGQGGPTVQYTVELV